MRRIEIPLLLVLVIALLAGCGGGDATPAATTPGSEQGAETPAQSQRAAPVATEAAGQPPAAEPPDGSVPAGEEEALDLENREDALKSLTSYRSKWSYSWTGKKDGKDQTVTWVVAQERTTEPAASHIRMDTTDSLDAEKSGAFEMIRIGAESYMLSVSDGKLECMAFSGDDQEQSDLTDSGPGSFGSIKGGRFVGEETINGIRTRHYRYDEKATGMNVYSRLDGDVWVAVDGGYAVRDTAEWEGRYIGASDDTNGIGTGSWTWELTDVNEPIEITAPENCASAAADIPIIPGATEKTTFGDMVSYKTAVKLGDAAKFYQDEMPNSGWTLEGDPMVTDQFANLTFVKAGQKANVMLSPDGTVVNVLITVEK